MSGEAWTNGPVTLYTGHVLEALRGLPAESVQCVVTSPPYWGLRDYGLEPVVWGAEPGCEHEWGLWEERHDEREAVQAGKTRTTDRFYGEESRRFDGNHQKHMAGAFCLRCGAWRGSLGLEPTPQLFCQHLVTVFREVRRVLRSDGVCLLNLGDTRTETREWAGLPHRLLFALQDDGWRYEDEMVWHKPNVMPGSQTNRTTRAHEMVFVLNKSREAFWDQEAVREADVRPGDVQTFGGTKALDTQIEEGDPRYRNGSEQWGRRIQTGLHGRNLRSVWSIATQPMTLEWCKGCGKVYSRAEYAYLRRGATARCQTVIDQEAGERCGGTGWAFGDGLVTCQECEGAYTLEEHEKLPRAKLCNRCKGDQWGSHFATFPEALVERCVLAGTSERGCCPECGAPWERVREPTGHLNHREPAHAPKSAPTKVDSTGWAPTTRATDEWRPTCAHGDLVPVPCTVLDPFSGAGTVAVVAQKLGRRAIGIDLSPQYTALAVKRLEEVPLPLGDIRVDTEPSTPRLG